MKPQLQTTAAGRAASRHAAPLLLKSRVVTVSDYKMALGIGVASGVLWYFVLARIHPFSGDKILILAGFLLFLPVATIAAAQRFFRGHVLHKFVKFGAVGVLNAGLDFFVFNMLISVTGLDRGISIVMFKSASFLAALFNSYWLNRTWTFDRQSASSWSGPELARFAAITVLGMLINVGMTSLIVNTMTPLLGLDQLRWDNVAVAVAAVLTLSWNFSGYKLLVFISPQGA